MLLTGYKADQGEMRFFRALQANRHHSEQPFIRPCTGYFKE